ncbi:1456_t:CDS:2, partial [Rhizophagus irregularis]
NFQQKQTPASTSRNAGQYFINDTELSHDSYKNTNDSYSDTSFENQRHLFRPQASQVKPNNCKAQGGEWSKREPTKLEIHLEYECAKYPENIREY